MFFKHIVISIIVIGCLVQFLTCEEEGLNKANKSNSRSKSAGSAIPQGTLLKPGASVSNNGSILKPRELSTINNKVEQNNKKPAGDDKKKKTENTTEFVNPDEDEEKPVGRFRKVFNFFGRLNDVRKKFCPFRFAGRAIKRGMGLDKPKSTNAEELKP